MWDLPWWANISQVVTGVLAVGTVAIYKCGMWLKRCKLENYLKAEKESGVDQGQRSVLHLMARLGLTESELLSASFRSKVIKRRLTSGEDGMAAHILFEYVQDSN